MTRRAMLVSFSKRNFSFFADDLLDDAVDLGIRELRLGLTFEAGLRQFHGDHRHQSFGTSSPVIPGSFSLIRLLALAKLLITRVRAVRKPDRCVHPPD